MLQVDMGKIKGKQNGIEFLVVCVAPFQVGRVPDGGRRDAGHERERVLQL